MENQLMKSAVSYARKGLSVVPMQGKKPMMKFADMKPMTEEEIIEFWSEYPSANIAIRTTSFFVIDVDVHSGAKGIQSFKSIGHDEWFKDTLVQRTASGGYHYFFMKPSGLNITQSINFMDGIDIKAHVNNYVLMAPSQINGNYYEFLNHKPIQTPCDELVRFIQSRQKPIYQMADFGKLNTEKTATTELFETIVNGLGDEGGRNDRLASFCGGLLFRNVEPTEVLSLAHIANNNTLVPLDDTEVERTVESMVKKEIRRREAYYGGHSRFE